MAVVEPGSEHWHRTIIACGGHFWFIEVYTGPEVFWLL